MSKKPRPVKAKPRPASANRRVKLDQWNLDTLDEAREQREAVFEGLIAEMEAKLYDSDAFEKRILDGVTEVLTLACKEQVDIDPRWLHGELLLYVQLPLGEEFESPEWTVPLGRVLDYSVGYAADLESDANDDSQLIMLRDFLRRYLDEVEAAIAAKEA